MATETLTCNFIGDFKVGDNIVSNAASLCRLVASNEGEIFNKLIVVQAGSITEAALDQIIYRAKNFNREKVTNISEKDRLEIASKKIERFKVLIEKMQEYKMLDGLGAGIYDDLHKLREYRNRIHIQLDDNLKDVSRDEDKAFTKEIVTWALALNIRVLKHLIEKYPRPKDLEQFAHELVLPNA